MLGLRVGRTMMLFSAAILAATAWLFVRVPKGFLPADDTGQVFAPTEAAQGISFAGRRASRSWAGFSSRR